MVRALPMHCLVCGLQSLVRELIRSRKPCAAAKNKVSDLIEIFENFYTFLPQNLFLSLF